MTSLDDCSFYSTASRNNIDTSGSNSRPQSSLAFQLAKNCQCRNCNINRGLGHYRPLSEASIRPIDVDAIIPGIPCLPTEKWRPHSTDPSTEIKKARPIKDCVWAWDSKYVEQKTAKFPWLPSGSLPRYFPYLKKMGEDKSYSKTTKKTLGYFVYNDIIVESPFHKKRKTEPPFPINLPKELCNKKRCLYRPNKDKDVDDWLNQVVKKPNPDLCEINKFPIFDPCLEEMSKLKDHGEYSIRDVLKMGSSSMCPNKSPMVQTTQNEDITRRQRLSCAFLSQISPSPQGSVRPSSSPSQPSERDMDSLLARECQMRVIAFDSQDGVFYPGVIVRCIEDNTSVVRYRNSGDLQVVPNYLNLPIKNITHTQTLQNSDTVLVRVKNSQTGNECWIPGLVTGGFLGSPDSRVPLSWRYPIQLFSGARYPFRRRDLIKISPKFHASLVKCIIDKNGGSSSNKNVKDTN